MAEGSHIAQLELSDQDSRFRLDAVLWGDPSEDCHLLLSVEVETRNECWRSKATAIVPPTLTSVAAAANALGSDWSSTGIVDYAGADGGPALAFSFRLLADGRVEVAVVVDSGLRPDAPIHPDDRPDQVLLRVRPEEVTAFAEALESLASHDPAHFAWVG